MGDFLDDYLDGLSSGQRFNPLPYGPYHGTKDKRQWHLLADSEREQAIYEARMLEEEESASAAAEGAAAEGGTGPVPEKLILDRRFLPDVAAVDAVPGTQIVLPDLTQAAVQYEQQNVTETFGFDVDETTGEVAVISQSLPPVDAGDPVVVTVVPDVQATTDWNDNSNVMMDSIMTGAGVGKVTYYQDNIWIVAIGDGYGNMETGWPGTFNVTTGYARPIIALGADYALQFKILFGYDSITSNDQGETFITAMEPGSSEQMSYMFSVMQQYDTTEIIGGVPYILDEGEIENTFSHMDDAWKQYNTGRIYMFDLELRMNIYDSPQQILDTVELAYQAQPHKYWSYGVIKLS